MRLMEKTWETGEVITADELNRLENRASEAFKVQDQSLYLSLFFQKLKTGKAVKIVCYGDSLTYGLDLTSSDKRPATPEQPNQASTRAGKTYPEQLLENLELIFPGQVTIEVRAIPGLTAEDTMTRWTQSAGEDLSIYCLGANDAVYGGMKSFQGAYRKLIQRSTEWGSGVLCLTPPRARKMVDVNLEVFRKASIKVCSEQDVPYLNLGEELANLSAGFYSDDIHFNTDGYSSMGSKVASFILAFGGLLDNTIQNGVLSIREIDGMTLISGCSYRNAISMPTGDFVEKDRGAALIIAPGGKCVYSFEASEDNLVVYPSAYLGKANAAKLKMSLNFELKGQVASSSPLFDNKTSGLTFPSSVVFTTPTDGNFYNIFYQTYYGAFITELTKVSDLNAKKLVITQRGYHSILIENTGTEEIQFYGLSFMPFSSFAAQVRSYQTGSIFRVFDSSASKPVPKTLISLDELFNGFRIDFSDQRALFNPSLRIVVQSTNVGVLEYIINLKSILSAGNNHILGPNMYEVTNGDKRELTAITLDETGLTLDWGNGQVAGNVVISLG